MSQRSTQAIQEIKIRLNIVDIISQYVKLQKVGARWVAPCPFHQETKPSFSVNEEGFFYCFGCQASGDIFTFYSQINGISFGEALRMLSEEAGVSIQDTCLFDDTSQAERAQARQKIIRLHGFVTTQFMKNYSSKPGEECRKYIEHRGISEAVIEAFSLGWSLREWDSLLKALRNAGYSDSIGVESGVLGRSEKSGKYYDRFRGRLMFPIKSLSGNIVAFGGRIIGDEDEPKYINSSDSPLYKKGDHLYGLCQARKSIAAGNPLLLTEGYMDVLTLYQYGYHNAVGVLGTALTQEQVKRISGFTSKIEVVFDGDNAGRKAALRACEMFLTRGLSCKIIYLPEGEDVDSLLRKSGRESFDEIRKKAFEGIQFCVHMLKDLSPRDSIEWVRNFLLQVQFPELLSRFISVLATGLSFSEYELREYVTENNRLAKKDRSNAQGEKGASLFINPRDRQIMMFLVRYPHAVKKLKETGAYAVLSTPWARDLWGKIEKYSVDEIIHYLTLQEKGFWVLCRTGDVAPLENEDGEFMAVQRMISMLHRTAQSASVSAALRNRAGSDDFDADLEYLRALQETLERTHGE